MSSREVRELDDSLVLWYFQQSSRMSGAKDRYSVSIVLAVQVKPGVFGAPVIIRGTHEPISHT